MTPISGSPGSILEMGEIGGTQQSVLSWFDGANDSLEKKTVRRIALVTWIALSIILPTALTSSVQHPFYLPLVLVVPAYLFAGLSMYTFQRGSRLNTTFASTIALILNVSMIILSSTTLYRQPEPCVSPLIGTSYILSYLPTVLITSAIMVGPNPRIRDTLLGVACMTKHSPV